MLLAQDFNAIQSVGLPGFTGGANIGEFIANSKIMDYLFGAAAIALLVYLVQGGLQMMLSKGDPKTMQGAQAKITNALIGFVIVFFAFAIVSVIGKILGISVFGLIFK